MTVIIQESDLLPESLDSDLSGIRKEADSRTVPDRPDKDSLRQDTLTENLTRKPDHLPHPIFFYYVTSRPTVIRILLLTP